MARRKPPVPLAERVAASQARAVQAGARKMTVLLPPAAVEALENLRRGGYSPSATGCIVRALIDAAERRVAAL